jgi:hypothetical protein
VKSFCCFAVIHPASGPQSTDKGSQAQEERLDTELL